MANSVNIVVFTIIAVFGYGVSVLLTKYIPFEYIPIPAGLIYLIGLILAYYFLPSHGKINNEGYTPSYDSLHQAGYSGDNLFEVTPAKKCCLFPNEPGCENITQEEKDCVCCGNGFHGRPVFYDYTPESNSNWQSTRCKNKDKYSECASGPLTPPVL